MSSPECKCLTASGLYNKVFCDCLGRTFCDGQSLSHLGACRFQNSGCNTAVFVTCCLKVESSHFQDRSGKGLNRRLRHELSRHLTSLRKSDVFEICGSRKKNSPCRSQSRIFDQSSQSRISDQSSQRRIDRSRVFRRGQLAEKGCWCRENWLRQLLLNCLVLR